jgi:hypothetical protein
MNATASGVSDACCSRTRKRHFVVPGTRVAFHSTSCRDALRRRRHGCRATRRRRTRETVRGASRNAPSSAQSSRGRSGADRRGAFNRIASPGSPPRPCIARSVRAERHRFVLRRTPEPPLWAPLGNVIQDHRRVNARVPPRSSTPRLLRAGGDVLILIAVTVAAGGPRAATSQRRLGLTLSPIRSV